MKWVIRSLPNEIYDEAANLLLRWEMWKSHETLHDLKLFVDKGEELLLSMLEI